METPSPQPNSQGSVVDETKSSPEPGKDHAETPKPKSIESLLAELKRNLEQNAVFRAFIVDEDVPTPPTASKAQSDSGEAPSEQNKNEPAPGVKAYRYI